jgi:tRNA (mo5U34)-methyltransferase
MVSSRDSGVFVLGALTGAALTAYYARRIFSSPPDEALGANGVAEDLRPTADAASPPPYTISTKIEQLFDPSPRFLSMLESGSEVLAKTREAAFYGKIRSLVPSYNKNSLSLQATVSERQARQFEEIASTIAAIPRREKHHLDCSNGVLKIGARDELSQEGFATFEACLEKLKPWKKGPLQLFDVDIDTEWRSDWKWDRLEPHLPSLEGKNIADLGCANGYFMFRMLPHKPNLVVGIDPNMKSWLEFKLFNHFAQAECLHMECLDGDHMDLFPKLFDVVFCLGVLYHTTDPIAMLRKMWLSMKPGGTLIVDCQGIAGDESMCLFPEKRYANASGKIRQLPFFHVL